LSLPSLDASFKRFTDSLSHRLKRPRRQGSLAGEEDGRREIAFSVFGRVELPEWEEEPRKTLDHGPVKTKEDFDACVSFLSRGPVDEGQR
jgi:hypothetical protein